MVQLNLVAEPKPNRRWIAWAAIGIASILVVGSWWISLRAPEVVPPRIMAIDEKETVIEVIERLQGDAPRFFGWLEELKEQVSDDALPCFIDRNPPASRRLVWETSDGLVFSPGFFDADTIAQEASLLRMIAGDSVPGKSDSTSLAVRGSGD